MIKLLKSRKISLQYHLGITNLNVTKRKQYHNIWGYVSTNEKFTILAIVVDRAKFNFIEGHIWQL